MSPQPGTGVLRVLLGKLFDQAAAGRVDVFGHDDLEHDEQVAAGLARGRGNTLALEPELEAARAARRDRERLHAVQGGDVDLGPQNRLGDADRNLDLEVLPLALEIGMGLDLDRDRQIAGGRSLGTGLPLALEPELGPRIDPWRNLDDEAFRLAVGSLNLDRSSRPP